MSPILTVEEVIDLLHLEPLPGEGGFYRQTVVVPNVDRTLAHAPTHTAILYLVTTESWSGLHMLPSPELFHFYLGDECDMVTCSPEGALEERRLGTDLIGGCQVQTLVPGGVWQATRLAGRGTHGYALLGTTMTPGYRQDGFRLATRTDLAGMPEPVAARLESFLAPEM